MTTVHRLELNTGKLFFPRVSTAHSGYNWCLSKERLGLPDAILFFASRLPTAWRSGARRAVSEGFSECRIASRELVDGTA